MFQFPGLASHISRIPCLQHGGLSHSEIWGSRDMCASPQLFAACHVLLRFQEPRHPPFALICFFFFSLCLSVFKNFQNNNPVARIAAHSIPENSIIALLVSCFCCVSMSKILSSCAFALACGVMSGRLKLTSLPPFHRSPSPQLGTLWRITDSNR